MPTVRTPRSHARRFRITPEAVEAWKRCRPWGIRIGGDDGRAGGFLDDELARCFDTGFLLAEEPEDMAALVAQLERAVGATTPEGPPDAA